MIRKTGNNSDYIRMAAFYLLLCIPVLLSVKKEPEPKKSDKGFTIKSVHYKSKRPKSNFTIEYPALTGILIDSLEKKRNNEFYTRALETKKRWIKTTWDLYNDADGTCRNSSEDFSCTITKGLLTNRCISYIVEKNGIAYCAPHPTHGFDFVTINLVTGQQMGLKEVFAGTDSIVWANLLATRAQERFLEDAIGFFPSKSLYFEPAAYFNNEQFVLNDSCISFYIDPIQINERKEGQIDFWMPIPYSSLKSAISKESPLWEITLKK